MTTKLARRQPATQRQSYWLLREFLLGGLVLVVLAGVLLGLFELTTVHGL